MSNDYAGLTPNIEARHMPHTNYSIITYREIDENGQLVDRFNLRVDLRPLSERINPPAEVHSTAHGLTQYPAPMSDGNTDGKRDKASESYADKPRCAYCGGDGTTCNAECRP